jgi:hypothetical protein
MPLCDSSDIGGFDDAYGLMDFVRVDIVMLSMYYGCLTILGIDQTNIDEKNHQVNLMDRIYSCAYSVRICVQDPVGLSESTDYNVLFQKLGRGDGLSPGTTAHAALTQAPRPSNIIVYDPSITPLASHIFSLRYFKRIWMLQEVVLAKNAYLIINTQEVLLTSIFLEGLLFNLRQYRIQVPSILSWRASQNTTSSIITCLQAGAHCDMTEPRDRIYAVLSLMEPHSRSLIPVDYASSIEAVFANAIAAVITDQQNLDVLAEAGIGVTGMCLDNERLSRFLLLKHGRNPIEYYVNTSSKALAPQFRGHATGSWRSTVDVRTISSDEHELEIKSNGNYSCIFVSPRPTHMDFLPRFRIRAHFIDSVDEMRIRRRGHEMPRIIAGHIVQDPRWLKHKDYSWMISLLGGQSSDTTWEPGKKITHPLSLGQWIHSATTADIGIPRTNLIDVKIFFEQAEKSAVRFFSSHFSLGFTRRDIEKGDEIFAVDGMRTPLILRRTGGDEYRIVAACWLWAALELDCWIPGTKKGRWGPDVERPTVKQTRMIEIH